MKIHLEILPHQEAALKAVLDALPPLDSTASGDVYANPVLRNAGLEKHFIDIKMETGTGKTYVYTRALYELQQKLGLFKFIIIVPSLAIKEGTKNFINSAYARQHFSQFFPNKRVELQTLNAGDFQGKKGRKAIPASLMQFCDATQNDKNTIQCLLISDKGFLDRKDSALFKSDYDQTFFGGFNCPIAALKNTRPIVIIDEPHRLKRSGNSYKNIMEKLKPQMILRFGATFPEEKGKMDYYRGAPQFDLNAVEAFNQDLVKGVAVQFPVLPENMAKRFKVKIITNKELIVQCGGKDWTVKAGESLSQIGGGFEGDVTYEGGKKLSNALELERGMELVEGVFSNSYQEILLTQALDAHFKTEEENFRRAERGEGYKIKTNALFFIDSIDSYRKADGWLKALFERLLREKLKALLQRTPSGAYHDFLQETKADLALAHGGYFAKDWGEADDSAAAAEREDILHKERSLPFKKPDGTWNIRRFFFSKWTLREGWDNPNVFTICKLRSSGSEISKLQEVGRGLRLPVDEQGNRVAGAEWKLNFIIGEDERDFAQKLVGEINRDAKLPLNSEKLTAGMIVALCDFRKISEEDLLAELDSKGIITRSNAFKEGGYEKLLQAYPELLRSQVKAGKITVPGDKPKMIKLRVENWKKIADFWREASKRYMVHFERIAPQELESLFGDVLNSKDSFSDNQSIEIKTAETQKSDSGQIKLAGTKHTLDNQDFIGQMPYNKFVRKLAERTALPIQIIHRQLWGKLQAFSAEGLNKDAVNRKLNQNSLEGIIGLWKEKFAETFAAKYNYDSLNFTATTSVWKNGIFVTEIAAGSVGNNLAFDIKDDTRNLYEPPFAYDSEIEHEVEKIKPSGKIAVFGKIPRRAIKVPTYTGGSTTPDFIYAVQASGKTDLILLIETKAKDMRLSEERAVAAQGKFFSALKDVEWKLVKEAGEVLRLLKDISVRPDR